MPTSPIPGGTVLATYPSDTSYRQNKALGLANAIGSAMANYRARREQQEQREQDEIKQFYALALANNDIASTQGDWFVAKYGRKYPQLAPLVDFIKNKRAEGEAVQASGQRFLQTQGAIEEKYRRDMEALAAMPDTVSVQVPVPSFVTRDESVMGTVDMDVPNPDKAARQAQLAHVQPWAFQHYAAREMTPLERQQARTAGAYTLDDFDPMKDDVPIEQRALYAAGLDWLNEDTDAYRAARAKNELEQSPADIAEQQYKTSEREAKEKAASARQERSGELQAGRLELSDKLQRARMALQASITSGHIQERAATSAANGKGAKGKPLWQLALDESQARVKAWQDGKSKAISEARSMSPGGKEAGAAARDAVNRYVNGNVGSEGRNGRPAQLSAAQAKRIMDAAQEDVAAGKVTPEQARFGVVAAVELFSRLTQQGVPAEKALKTVLEGDDGNDGGVH